MSDNDLRAVFKSFLSNLTPSVSLEVVVSMTEIVFLDVLDTDNTCHIEGCGSQRSPEIDVINIFR